MHWSLYDFLLLPVNLVTYEQVSLLFWKRPISAMMYYLVSHYCFWFVNIGLKFFALLFGSELGLELSFILLSSSGLGVAGSGLGSVTAPVV